VGTTMGFQVKIVEALAPQTSPPNPVEVTTIACEHLFRLMLRDTFLSPTQMEGTRATVEVNYPSTMGHLLCPVGADKIDSFQWQTAGEPYTPYCIKAPPLQAEEEGPPT
jgi:hypothetical protein